MNVSVIIVNYNTKDLTLKCLRSLEVEGSGVVNDVIVLDNASSDGSEKALGEFRTVAFKYTFIKNSENLGFAKANNIGIKKAKNPYILLLNSDTEVKSGSVGKLLDFTLENELVGVVGPRLLNEGGSVQSSCFHLPTLRSAILEYWFGRKGLLEKYTPEGNKPQKVDAVVGACFLITPQAVEKVGLLDERYFMYFEDIDYCRKVKKAGLEVYYFPQSEIMHLHGASGKTLSSEGDQWKRLIPSSKIYHGVLGHYLISFVILVGSKIRGK